MTLDARTLFVSMWVTVTLTALALALGVRWREATGIRAWSGALWLQSIGWAALMGAFSLWPRGMATIGATAIVASVSAMYVATQTYLRQRVSPAWAWGPALLTLPLHWIVFPHFAARIALVNGILGVQMLWLAVLLLRPSADGWRWRWLAGAGLAISGPLVLGRVAIAVLAPEAYPRFDSSHWLNVSGLIVNTACLTIGTLAFLLAHRDEAEQELARLASVDALSGLSNRRALMERGEAMLQLALRHRQPLAALMLDIDHFKQINDQRGHPVGDRVIERFADALKTTARHTDLVGRYGGEEFCLLMPMSGAHSVEVLDQRLRQAVAEHVGAEVGFDVNFSTGAALLGAPDRDLASLLGRADRALYAAKRQGRARLVIDTEGSVGEAKLG
jgi:diguanylate cyclase (GGDEF)-like protein